MARRSRLVAGITDVLTDTPKYLALGGETEYPLKQIQEMEARWILRGKDGRLQVQFDLSVVSRLRVRQRLVGILAKRGGGAATRRVRAG